MVTFITVCVCLLDLFLQTASMYRLVGIRRAFGTVARLRLICSAFSALFIIEKWLGFFLQSMDFSWNIVVKGFLV